MCSAVSNSWQPHELCPTRLFCPWNFPGKNTRVSCHFLLQEIFPIQRSNLCLLDLLAVQGTLKSLLQHHSSKASILWASGFPGSSSGKQSAYNVGDLGSVPGLGRSPGEGNDYLLQYSGLENPIDCIVCGVAKSQTQLSNFYFLLI